jgi:hypothetical protein
MAWTGRPTRPYISVIFANRNDNYGGDQGRRINLFIDYYAYFSRQWPGLFEFVICDWNPPLERPLLQDAYPWENLGRVTHVVVPPEVHSQVAGTKGRKILDYIGRNVAVRRAKGEFVLILNQDIFVSESIMSYLALKRLSKRHFYRADRCDFHLPQNSHSSPQSFEKLALDQIFKVHRRHSSADLPISLEANVGHLHELGSRIESRDRNDEESGILFCDPEVSKHIKHFRKQITPKHDCFRKLYLHTNAAGDFLLVPRSAFFAINGMPEATDFYMHLDSYALVQLFCAGWKQAIFLQPHRVLHADHDRGERLDFKESISWAEHEQRLAAMILGESTFRVNPKSWGLADYELPTTVGPRKNDT